MYEFLDNAMVQNMTNALYRESFYAVEMNRDIMIPYTIDIYFQYSFVIENIVKVLVIIGQIFWAIYSILKIYTISLYYILIEIWKKGAQYICSRNEYELEQIGNALLGCGIIVFALLCIFQVWRSMLNDLDSLEKQLEEKKRREEQANALWKYEVYNRLHRIEHMLMKHKKHD